MKNLKKIVAVILSLTMIIGLVQLTSYATTLEAELPFATISDVHYYPDSLMGSKGDVWSKMCKYDSKLYEQSEAIIRTGLDTIGKRAEKTGIKYVLVPGDLTRNSEYEAHVKLAEIFEEYEAKYGLQFIVINGNHDVNTTAASTYENDIKEDTRAITAKEFREVYKNLGYDLATKEYASVDDNKTGELSYVVDFDDDYRLIVVDSCKYSFGEPEKDQTGGAISDELMGWIKDCAAEAKANGMTPFVMMHHSVAPHMEVEPSITFAFPVDNYLDVAEQFASFGIHYVFTGHLHTSDIARVVNDDGEAIYDCETASLTGFPCTYNEQVIRTYSDGETKMTYNTVDFDDVEKLTYGGVTYDNNSFRNEAFRLCFGGGMSEDGEANATEFLMGMVKNMLSTYLDKIVEAGGVVPFLKTMNIDLEGILSGFLEPYIGKGFSIGGYSVFTVQNLMWFINDLCDQLTDIYIKNPQNLYDLLTPVVEEILSMEVSEKPCTKFISTLGFGDENKPGTLEDLIFTVMAYWYQGNEDTSDDEFINDAIKQFDSGDKATVFFNTVVDLLLHDVIEDGILSKLEIRVDKLIDSSNQLGVKAGEGINYLLKYVLRGDFTYMNLVNTVYALQILPYKDIYDTLDQLLLKKYLTDSQLESVGIFIAYVLDDFANDSNPQEQGDYNVTYSSENVAVETTRKNYRLPTMVSETLGEDPETEATINWFSKSTVGGDIEIYKADSEPEFNGVPTTSSDITIESEKVTRSFPGIDLGVIGFIQYEFKMNRHTATLTNLEPGATYYYRVGDASRGWWSQTGKIETADGSDSFTFFHMTDPQAQNERQYNRAWVNVLDNAFNLYPDAKLIVATGDLVDHGDNTKQWQYMFDTGSDYLMNTYLMPVTGNHEGKGTNATVSNFALPNVPQQDTTSGVYYSYDYNNAHFAVLNTEALGDDDALTKEQIDWLTADMNASDAEWKFVALHKALYSQGSHYSDDDVCAMREQLGTLMPKLGIDMVFEGHDHVYLRTGSLDGNVLTPYEKTYLNHNGEVYKTEVQPAGTTYVITGTAGVKSYIQNDVTKTDKYFPRGEKILSVDAPMFAAIQIEDGVLYFNAYSVGDDEATCVDRFAIQKDTTQGDVAKDYQEAEEQVKEDSFLTTIALYLEKIIYVLRIIMNIFGIYILGVNVG